MWPRNTKEGDGKELHPKVEQGLRALNDKLHQGALFLQEKASSYSKQSQKRLLALFCLVLTAASIILILHESVDKTTLQFFRSPAKLLLLQENKQPKLEPISHEVVQRMQHFKWHLDSLGTTERGITIRDSFLQKRPHLLDSINYLESIYNQQRKTYGK